MIRKADIKDIPKLVEIGRLFHSESEHFSKCSYSPIKVIAFLEGLLNNDEALLNVIEKDGEIIGGMAAVIFQEWYSVERLATDICVFILPEYRGSSMAAEMIEKYKEWAKGRGAVYSLLSVGSGINMERTQQFYEKLGARYIGPLLAIK